jgi:hypothetical protein
MTSTWTRSRSPPGPVSPCWGEATIRFMCSSGVFGGDQATDIVRGADPPVLALHGGRRPSAWKAGLAAADATHVLQKYPKGCIVAGGEGLSLSARPQEIGGLPKPSAPPAVQAAGRDHVHADQGWSFRGRSWHLVTLSHAPPETGWGAPDWRSSEWSRNASPLRRPVPVEESLTFGGWPLPEITPGWVVTALCAP